MKYRRNFVQRSSRMTSFAGLSRYAGPISNAPVAGLNTRRPQASVRSGAAQLTLTISDAIDVSATSLCVSIWRGARICGLVDEQKVSQTDYAIAALSLSRGPQGNAAAE